MSNKVAEKMVAWNIYLNGNLINTVYYLESCDAEYVKDGLVNHDGLHPNIKVYRERLS